MPRIAPNRKIAFFSAMPTSLLERRLCVVSLELLRTASLETERELDAIMLELSKRLGVAQ